MDIFFVLLPIPPDFLIGHVNNILKKTEFDIGIHDLPGGQFPAVMVRHSLTGHFAYDLLVLTNVGIVRFNVNISGSTSEYFFDKIHD